MEFGAEVMRTNGNGACCVAGEAQAEMNNASRTVRRARRNTIMDLYGAAGMLRSGEGCGADRLSRDWGVGRRDGRVTRHDGSRERQDGLCQRVGGVDRDRNPWQRGRKRCTCWDIRNP